ncbi:MAG: flagellar basal body P-ring formation chaperone FlgA [Betaproteobacteria bacterium]
MKLAAHRILLACVLTILAMAGDACADSQDLGIVRRAAEAFARSETSDLPGDVVVEAGTLDQRLRLGACASLQAYLPPGSKLWGRSNVGVRCQHPDRWSIMVPVMVQVMADGLYAARPMSRGQPVVDEDLVVHRVDITQLPAGVLTDRTQATGRIPIVSLAAGLPLRGEQLRGAYVVTQGQSVQIMFPGDGFTVSSEGRALGNAALGEQVLVKAASGKVVKGRASGVGLVEVK